MKQDNTERYWFPMLAAYSREQVIKEELDRLGIENFLLGFDHLIFVHASRSQISELKQANKCLEPLRYMVIRHDVQSSTVVTVPDHPMQQFIQAMSVEDPAGQRTYLTYSEFLGREGQRVRFLRGPFQGIEGTVKRIRNNRHLVIALPHVGALAISIPSISDLEPV